MLSWIINIRAITLFPFIFIADEGDDVLIQHESIHIRQQLELLVIGFYIIYVIDYVIKYFKYGNGPQAYRNIVFEQEAYNNQHEKGYLSRRRWWECFRK
ncbi:MAG TPA: hypothetical protein DHN29_09935 [Cytophagales bacterium]|jgi:hypothetical protein|nr:hypothetical protein [Cytophagales bacterium]